MNRNFLSRACAGLPQFFLVCLLALSGPALANEPGPSDPRDPWEGYNRAVYGFNKGVDEVIVKPLSLAYDAVTPEPVDQGITNFFSNLGDVRNFLNNMLQGKPKEGFNSLGRLLINSTIGLLGFIDVATEIGLEKSEEDFGQTLAVWGAGPGPYFVLPILGPSTVRDAIGKPFDFAANPATWAEDDEVRWGAYIVAAIDYRADLLKTEEAIEGITEDEYLLVRNAYLDQRAYDVSDGAVTDSYDIEE